MKAKQRYALRQQLGRWGRLAIQLAFFLTLPGLFSAGFNGFKYLFTTLGTGAPIEASAFAVTLLILLVITVFLGRIFCGFACAFGTLGDVLYGVFSWVWAKTPFPPLRFPEPLVRGLSFVKYGILAAIGLLCFFGLWSAISMDSPWVAFAGILSGSMEGISVIAFVILGLLALGMMVRERFFCQFFCPLGALFSLMPALGPVGFMRNPERCPKNCGLCHKNCPVGLWPDVDTPVHGECIACGRCAVVCPRNNVRLLTVGPQCQTDAAYACKRTSKRAGVLGCVGFCIPVVLTAALALSAVNAYEPVVFDPAEVSVPEVPEVTLAVRDLPEERGGAATLEITMPPEALEGTLKDGTYQGAALCGLGNDENWKPYYVVVEIEVKKGRVVGVTDISGDSAGIIDADYRYDAAENSLYLDRAIEGTGGRFSKGALKQIEELIASGETQGGVDTVSGSTYSVVSIVQAYNRAVAEAVEQAK